MKKLVSTLLALALVLSLGACAAKKPSTPAEYREAMIKAAEKTPCSAMEMTMEMSVGMEFPPEMDLDVGPMEMKMAVSGSVVVNADPYADHGNIKMDISVMGEDTTTQLETYNVIEDGAMVSYMGTDGVWVRTVTGETPESIQSLQQNIQSIVPENGTQAMALDETVTAYKDKPAVGLTYKVSGKDTEAVLNEVLKIMSEESELTEIMKDLDWSAISYEGLLYLDPETCLPIALEMTVSGLDQLYASLFADTGMTITVGTVKAVMEYTSYEPQAPITVPEDVKANAIAE